MVPIKNVSKLTSFDQHILLLEFVLEKMTDGIMKSHEYDEYNENTRVRS